MEEVLLVGGRDVHIEGVSSARVGFDNFDPLSCRSARAVFVAAQDPARAFHVARAIRQHPAPRVYLKPVFLLEPEVGALPRPLALAADGATAQAQAAQRYREQFHERIATIEARMARLPEIDSSEDTNIAFKVIRLAHTRGLTLEPLMSANAVQGYLYPPVELFFNQEDGSSLRVLRFLEEQRLLAGQFVDRIFSCGHCACAFLSFREICTHCKSANLEVDDLVHHFRCAHVAPMSDFEVEGEMRCPKCEKALKHIGVDYDKPSSVYLCGECGRLSQEVDTVATCYQCGRSASPDAQDNVVIRRYTLTALAENAALHGMDSMFRQVLESELDTLPIAVFRRVLKLEAERIARYKISQSSLVLLQMRNLDRIQLEEGAHAKKVFQEMVEILKSVLRSSDVITSLNDSLHLILFVETPEAGVRRAIERVQERVQALFESNLKQHPELSFHHAPITPQRASERLIEDLVKNAEA